ncbi:MAG: hypothetical protein ACD_79C01288G0001, partial [uncultured bacterium]
GKEASRPPTYSVKIISIQSLTNNYNTTHELQF